MYIIERTEIIAFRWFNSKWLWILIGISVPVYPFQNIWNIYLSFTMSKCCYLWKILSLQSVSTDQYCQKQNISMVTSCTQIWHLCSQKSTNIYRPRSEGDNVLGSVRPSVCPSVCGHSHASSTVSICPPVSSFPRSKVIGQCQGQIFWRVAVDTRGSALPSAAKANNHPQVWKKWKEHRREESLSVRGICLCVDYLARMRSIGF